MPTNYSGRVITIVVVLLAALWAIFPSFNPKRPDLKPGIDMVGGTSLLYEIDPPEGGQYTENLAEQVAASLKKRVDPDGVRNLIWRPQGNTRLEIQMPLTQQSGEAETARKAFAAAQRQLEATNARVGAVLDAVEKRKGDERRAAFERLSMGSEARAKLFGALASAYDRVQAAKEKKDAAAQAQAELEYEKLKRQITETNLSSAELEAILSLQNQEQRQKRLAELKARFKDFPQRVAAIDAFVKAHAAFADVKGTLDDASDLKRLLRGSGVLEFYILVTDLSSPQAQAMIERLQTRGPIVQAGDEMRWLEVEKEGGLQGLTQTYNDKEWVLAWVAPDKSMTNVEGQNRWALERAYPTTTEYGARVVGFRFDPQGGKYFGDLTAKNIGQMLAISLDDKIISAPRINSQIGREGIIDGGDKGFSNAELTYLISTLNAGSLPAKLEDEPISERTVGPQLGKDNLRRGLAACVFGLIVVATFLIGYYFLAGAVAYFAVLMNLVLILGAMAMLNATFTLPSIAGIVLTIGMAVDANVLIFERLREEQQRGLSLRMALRNAYDRAFSAIFDGNVTTGITSACLYLFGSEEVKGFGLTLLLGIVASLFTALFVTKTIFGLLIEHNLITRLSSIPLTFPKWDRMLRPNIDWLSKAWIAYTFSGAFITIGLLAFGAKWAQGRILDIEFASGTSVQFDLKRPTPIEEVRKIIDEAARKDPQALGSPSVVSVGTDETTYEVVTAVESASNVRQAVVTALGDRLKIELPSTFAGVGTTSDVALGQQIVPIKNDTQEIAGFVPPGLASHLQGAAVVLRDLDPPLKPSEIKARIERARLAPQPGQTTPPYREFDVVSPDGTDEPSTTAVVLVSDPVFPHDQDEAKWADQLVRPFWRLVNEGINAPPELQRVSNFDAQVAGETQREALIALILSFVLIMTYIWIRFGNLKYGTATVIALLHDTLFVLAAVGVAHYAANTFVGDLLLIEPFRINLTMTAAILTVMGYSMNDTVVVFDRIRENRGKFGHVSRSVINDSINQTLSRTLLTGGTTILTIFVMYVFGGAGIHGFTFALLVGILVGTYSSIAIAAPILLFGTPPGEEHQPSRGRESEAKKAPAGQLQRA
ncbi:MAG TPA: protein translocase subunit SecD [Tepidisphaeraceae bacterium]|nr:protein translocase subunit SecD [Tepidisphaeraceae bacterium]